MGSHLIPDCRVLYEELLPYLGSFQLNQTQCCTSPNYVCEDGKLISINLNNQNLYGALNPNFKKLAALSTLNLSSNNLIGDIPETIGQMTSLKKIDLSNNRLTGTIPKSFDSLSNLEYLNLSWNNLSRPVPPGLLKKVEMNSTNINIGSLFEPGKPSPDVSHRNVLETPILVPVLIITTIIGMVTTLLLFKRNNRKNGRIHVDVLPIKGKDIDIIDSSKINSAQQLISSGPPNLIFDMRLTIESRIVGSGGSGTVYKATIGGRLAVVKIPKDLNHKQMLFHESQVMAKLSSPYIVEYLGFIADAQLPNQPPELNTALIIEYMNLGSLSKYLNHSLTSNHPDYINQQIILKYTLDISIMIAKGLDYIHQNGYTHSDVKANNILIHLNENHQLITKLADFGSASEENMSSVGFQTPGYIAPESAYSELKTSKYDIYSFGFTIIHIITRLNLAIIWNRNGESAKEIEENLKAYIKDLSLLNLILSYICEDPTKRPTASAVIEELNQLTQEQFTMDKTLISQLLSKSDAFVQKNQLTSYDSLSELHIDSPGAYLLRQLSLTSPSPWNVFAENFKSKYSPNTNFKVHVFESRVQPELDMVSSRILSDGLFKDVPALSADDDEEAWISIVDDAIENIIYFCNQ
ncbi:kinase-like domain-containing protein [Globomyces pollinis-pini]|nr:kinase-like domain-containing protein [Globomyces pollinis-pini]